MSALGQFDAGYNQHEDRILLRITNQSGEEFRLWLTRRICASLLTDFKTRTSAYRVSAIDRDTSNEASATPDHDTLLRAQFEQQAAVAQQDLNTEFAPGETYPLGESGLLVEKINLQPNGQGQDNHSLSFANAQGEGITLGVSIELFNAIFEVIERVVQQTNWELPSVRVGLESSNILQ